MYKFAELLIKWFDQKIKIISNCSQKVFNLRYVYIFIAFNDVQIAFEFKIIVRFDKISSEDYFTMLLYVFEKGPSIIHGCIYHSDLQLRLFINNFITSLHLVYF